MTRQQLKERGYKIVRTSYPRNKRPRRRHQIVYRLLGPEGEYLGSISPTANAYGYYRWGAYPRLKGKSVSRVRAIGIYGTIANAADAIIRFLGAPPKTRRPSVTCPRCGSSSRKVNTLGGVQTRRCRYGHLFEYDAWMADRIIWAPGAIGNLRQAL